MRNNVRLSKNYFMIFFFGVLIAITLTNDITHLF